MKRFVFPLVSISTGVAWWGALMLSPPVRDVLLARYDTWNDLRLIGIVAASCLLYREVRRRWPNWGWLGTPLYPCLGSAVFLWEGLDGVWLAPMLMLVVAWHIVLPMTLITAITLSQVDRLLSRTPSDRLVGR